MRKSMIWSFVLVGILIFVTGCEKQKIPETAAMETNIATEATTTTETTETTELTEDELAYFNGDSFFNGEYLNIRNQFMSSIYSEPSDIDLASLFYCGTGSFQAIAEYELKEVMEKAGISGSIDELPCGCDKITRSDMNKVLSENMGITLEYTKNIGLDHFVFLSQYDAYYHFHGDTNYRGQISFSRGEHEDDLIRLYYNDEFFGDGDKVLTLRDKNGVYLFVANQMAELEKATD